MTSSSNQNTPATPTAQPWHAAYPAPKCTAPGVERQLVLQWLREGRKNFVLVDLRRNDFEGGTIRGSLNLPAQSLFPSLPSLHSAISGGKVKQVIWYCGSSGGRGTRAAAWFADYLEQEHDTELKSLVLEGGIKGWVASGKDYTEWMDGYDASHWA
ncbi:hypothetical protein N7454_001797, partial [Penicillium verhagenii]